MTANFPATETAAPQSKHSLPTTADLNDPLYYLANFETVIRWVRNHHSDLLLPEELSRIDDLMEMPSSARALVARMVMRTHDLFRVEKLHYPELERPAPDLLSELMASGWVEPEPKIGVSELFRLYTLAELRPALSETITDLGLRASAAKNQLLTAMMAAFPEPAGVSEWLPGLQTRVIRLGHMDLFDRLRLMFFGNLRQSWSDFVLVELGHQQFEQVPFTPDARAFDQRDDVDRYLLLHHCRERLDDGESPEEILQDVPDAGDNAWLESRRGRLLFQLARQAERDGDIDLALSAYRDSRHREARLRRLRLLERQKRFDEAWKDASKAHESPRNEAESEGLQRLLKRLSKKVGEAAPPVQRRPKIPKFSLTLDNPEGYSVEWRTMEHLSSKEAPVAYVENTLITGLFGLLCWPAVFAPVPGAFFHPFHNGPVDLYREDFLDRRSDLFDDCLSLLDSGAYRDRIREVWRQKQGITSPFVVWPVFSEALLEMALECLPAAHLKYLFIRLMDDLRQHRSGLPDLIQFRPHDPDPNRRYEMIEVKGPGDRLQDHQTRWLEYCLNHGLPVSVCYVQWQAVE